MFNSKEQREEWVSRVVQEAIAKAVATVKRSLDEQWAEIRMQTCKKSGGNKLTSSQPERVRKEMITEIWEEIEEGEGDMHKDSKSVLNGNLDLVEREDFSGLNARAGLTVTSGGGGRSRSGPANSHSEPPGGSFERGGANSSGSGGGPGNSASGRGKFVKGGSEASGSGGGPGGEGSVMGIRARGGELGGYVVGNISGGQGCIIGGPKRVRNTGYFEQSSVEGSGSGGWSGCCVGTCAFGAITTICDGLKERDGIVKDGSGAIDSGGGPGWNTDDDSRFLSGKNSGGPGGACGSGKEGWDLDLKRSKEGYKRSFVISSFDLEKKEILESGSKFIFLGEEVEKSGGNNNLFPRIQKILQINPIKIMDDIMPYGGPDNLKTTYNYVCGPLKVQPNSLYLSLQTTRPLRALENGPDYDIDKPKPNSLFLFLILKLPFQLTPTITNGHLHGPHCVKPIHSQVDESGSVPIVLGPNLSNHLANLINQPTHPGYGYSHENLTLPIPQEGLRSLPSEELERQWKPGICCKLITVHHCSPWRFNADYYPP